MESSFILMSKLSKRKWRVLCWNVRGLNSEQRQRYVRAKIEERECDIIRLQETKCESFDWRFIRKFCPKRFDSLAYSPSKGASGGIIVLWNSAIFTGILIDTKSFGITVNFTSVHNMANWTMVGVYGPCHGIERDNFVTWLHDLNIPSTKNWLVLGDFNFVRSQENRNRSGGDINDMFLFNEVIGHLGLMELPLKGRKFTWSDMQKKTSLGTTGLVLY
jgi:exonuclease III